VHEALGGDDQAILIAHDWGAVGAWGAAGKEPGRWRLCIIPTIPPFAISGDIVTYDQIKRSSYFWYFQNQRVCEDVISAGNLCVHRPNLGRLLPRLRRLRGPGQGQGVHPRPSALPGRPGPLPGTGRPQPVRLPRNRRLGRPRPGAGTSPSPPLHLHGTQDGCHGMTCEQVSRVPQHCAPDRSPS
jgi:hypothetical protein